MAMNQIFIEGKLRKGSDIYPNKKELSEKVFIEYEELKNLTWLTLLQSDDMCTINRLLNHIGEHVVIRGKLDGTAISVQDFSCLK